MKKGEINFNQNKIATLKNELKELEEQQRNIPQWIASAKNFEYGNDLGGSDETVITRLFDVPIMVYDWPHEVKAFYLKRNPDNPRFARGVDVLAPEGYGEIVGGGERETDEMKLREKIIYFYAAPPPPPPQRSWHILLVLDTEVWGKFHVRRVVWRGV